MIATLAEEPELEFVGDVADESRICERVHQSRPDSLLMALDKPARGLNLRHALARTSKTAHYRRSCSAKLQRFYFGSFDIHSSEIESSERGILSAVRNITPTGAGERL